MSEDDLGSISGALIIEDGDWGESTFKPVAAGDLQKQYGAFTFNSATGQWSFTLNGNAQALKQDQQVQQMLLVESLDGTATRTIIVTIIGRNDAPVAAVDGNSVSGLEDTAIAGQVPAGTDVDGDSLTYALLDPVDGLTFHEDGTFSYVPAVDFKGNVTFRYRVLDGNGGASQPQTITIKVGTVNDAPHDILLSNTRVKENAKAGAIVGTLTGLDVDGDALTFSLLDNAGGRFAISNGQLVVKDGVRLDYEQATTHTVTIRVTDASQASYTETFLIGLDNVTGESIDGSSASDLLMGDSGKDVIKGGSGDDTVHGGAGNDTLWGGLGNDRLYGGLGKDIFVFDTKANTRTNTDKLFDFSVRDDAIWLDNKVFTKLGRSGSETKPFQLKKDVFVKGAKAKDKNDHLIYDNKKGVLLYDADGSGKGQAVVIATLSKNLKITEKDFFVI
jgi:VCBS repeat-containing protein